MFIGEYHHNIDEKGRIVLPGKFRNNDMTKIVVTRGLEKCLYLYTVEDWEKVVSKLNTLPFTKKDARIFARSFFSAAAEGTFDRQGRISITNNQWQYANLIKDCVIIGVNERIEIWSEENWITFNQEYSDALEEVAENLFNGDANAL